jgi:hypothetical protein
MCGKHNEYRKHHLSMISASAPVSFADGSKSTVQTSLNLVNDVPSRKVAMSSVNTTSSCADPGVKSYKDVILTGFQPKVSSAHVGSDGFITVTCKKRTTEVPRWSTRLSIVDGP